MQFPPALRDLPILTNLEHEQLLKNSGVATITRTQEAKQHQGEFIAGISDVVVGKDIDTIKVDKVGGSSLTSGGFNKAVEEIKADAAA